MISLDDAFACRGFALLLLVGLWNKRRCRDTQ